MGKYTDLRAARPVRYAIAVTVYRAIWWPVVGVALPFVLIVSLVNWLSWTAFPAIGRACQPLVGMPHKAARAAGNAVLGYKPPRGER